MPGPDLRVCASCVGVLLSIKKFLRASFISKLGGKQRVFWTIDSRQVDLSTCDLLVVRSQDLQHGKFAQF